VHRGEVWCRIADLIGPDLAAEPIAEVMDGCHAT